jgi:ABC-2 type transport system permease protein
LFLIVVSDILLGISPLAIGLHALAMLVLALGLSGLSVGLGAAMPNFSESDPSKIAVGFGGTLNLIAGLLYLLVVIATIAGPYHFSASASVDGDVPEPLTAWWFYAGLLLGLVFGAVAMFGPMRLGIRHLERMEF